MKILLDENLPKPLARIFAEHSVSTVQEAGLAGTRLVPKLYLGTRLDAKLCFAENEGRTGLE